MAVACGDGQGDLAACDEHGTTCDDAGGQREDSGDGTDTADLASPVWGETPFAGAPRESYCWGVLLWDGLPDYGDYLAQLSLPVTRDHGSAAADFSAAGAFPGTAEAVVVEGSSVRDEALLATEGCSFDTSDPAAYADPGTWWFATSGRVEVDATYVSSSEGGCGENAVFELDVNLAGLTLETTTGDSVSVSDVAWSGLFAGFPSCPPE